MNRPEAFAKIQELQQELRHPNMVSVTLDRVLSIQHDILDILKSMLADFTI